MNERIKELADQAENYAYSAVIGGSECMEAYTKKFAELIVKDVFAKIKESCVDTEVMDRIDEIINDRLGDAAGDICDAYGIVDRIY